MSLFDQENITSDEAEMAVAKKWIEDNFEELSFRIEGRIIEIESDKSKSNITVKNKSIDRLLPEGWSFGHIDGHFNCSGCHQLTSLEGAPKSVKGGFDCSYCTSLKSLSGAPSEVSNFFDCSGCHQLTSLEGAPDKIGGDFCCTYCPIENYSALEKMEIGGTIFK